MDEIRSISRDLHVFSRNLKKFSVEQTEVSMKISLKSHDFKPKRGLLV